MKFFRKTSFYFYYFALLFALYSCGKAENEKPNKAERKSERSEESKFLATDLSCQGQKVVEILENGNLIVSRILKEKNRLLIWDRMKNAPHSSLFFPGAYHKMSSNGKYLLNRLSYRRYQLAIFNKNSLSQTVPLSFYSADNPDIKFSRNSKFLIIRYKPVTSPERDLITLYDIEKRSFSKSIRFENVRHIELSRDENFLYFGTEKGRHKKIIKYDISNDLVLLETGFYSKSYFNQFKLLENSLFTIDNGKYVFYDTNSGKLLYQKDFRYIYDVSKNGKFLLVAPALNEIAVFDVDRGELLYQRKMPNRLYGPSCQLRTSQEIICQDNDEPGKIISWDLKSNNKEQDCYKAE